MVSAGIRSAEMCIRDRPWALAKDPEKKDRLSTVLYNLVESITIGASLLTPVSYTHLDVYKRQAMAHLRLPRS